MRNLTNYKISLAGMEQGYLQYCTHEQMNLAVRKALETLLAHVLQQCRAVLLSLVLAPWCKNNADGWTFR